MGSENINWKQELREILFSKKATLAFMMLVGLIGLRMGLNSYLSRGPKETAPLVRVVHPTAQPLDSSISLPGNVEAIEQASLYAHVSGYLKKIYVDEGDTVKKNEVLAEIDAPDIGDEYNTLKADLDLKTVTRTRYKELVDERVISEQEFDNIDAAYNEAKAKFDNAATNMEYTHIRAPFNGSVARRYQYPGDFISVSSRGSQQIPIFLIVNEEVLRVVVNVPQVEVAHVHVNNPVDIKVDGFPDEIFPGTVTRLDALMDSSTKTQRVLIDIKNPEKKLHGGMFASVVLHFEHKDRAIIVPSDVLETQDGKTFVYLFADGKAKKQLVVVGATQSNDVEIIDGLSPTDLVIRKGLMTLIDGMKVAEQPLHPTAETESKDSSSAQGPASVEPSASGVPEKGPTSIVGEK